MRSRPSKVRAAARAQRPSVSRRRFMALLASASAATLAAPARPLVAAAAAATAAKKRAPAPAPAPTARVAAEIEKQKKSVADALKVIRDFPLPAGSPMAFEFRPLRAKRGR
jgi:hypothetical protein